MEFTTAKKVASVLAYQFIRTTEAERPVDKSRTAAEFKGGCKVANAVGFGNTEFHVEITVFEAFRSLTGASERPGFRAMGNEARKAWDEAFIEAVTMDLLTII